jgi:hypothetical protein
LPQLFSIVATKRPASFCERNQYVQQAQAFTPAIVPRASAHQSPNMKKQAFDAHMRHFDSIAARHRL